MGLDETLINGALATDDPVEWHIMQQLQKLRYKNMRLLKHLKQSGDWAALKKVEEWKPYDFFQYFCNLYQEKYRTEYNQNGNIVRAYQRIEAFINGNGIGNKAYKEFIDKAFKMYFTNVNRPKVANICSPSLFRYMTDKYAKLTTTQDFYSLDQKIAREMQEFDKYMRENS